MTTARPVNVHRTAAQVSGSAARCPDGQPARHSNAEGATRRPVTPRYRAHAAARKYAPFHALPRIYRPPPLSPFRNNQRRVKPSLQKRRPEPRARTFTEYAFQKRTAGPGMSFIFAPVLAARIVAALLGERDAIAMSCQQNARSAHRAECSSRPPAAR